MWNIKKSKKLYRVNKWGKGYFGINDKGNATVKLREGVEELDLKEIIDKLQLSETNAPILLRFPDILENSIKIISEAFKNASEEFEFTGNYHTVYPIKVNQMKPVVEEIVKAGNKYNIGLEAGSKPELHAVLAVTENDDDIIVCNGYKDEEFLELALLAKKTEKNIHIVVEKLNELKLIIKISKTINVSPNIGIRIKLNASGSGKWADSGGDKSKFGLNSSELIEAVAIAQEADMLDRIKMIHFHLGSQITQIRNIKSALREAARYFVELSKLGCKIDLFDVGGGLGVDYDGTRSSQYSSINYSIQEYANDVVFAIADVCKKHDLDFPDIITESGRAISAYHSVLIFDVLEKMTFPFYDSQNIEPEYDKSENNELLDELHEIWTNLDEENAREFYHDANQIREETNNLFSLGHLGLTEKAITDKYYWSILKRIIYLQEKYEIDIVDTENLESRVADKYFCNFSLFQSLPDSWAIDQLFPIMPIHRLDEEPVKKATLQDITCDSDGRINKFISQKGQKNVLRLHEFHTDEKYYIAVFLIGAYQEILGDMHNLFGDTNAVHIGIVDNKPEIIKIIDGETIDEVLSFVGFNAKELVKKMESWVSNSVKSGKISAEQGKEYLANYRSGLYGYTYLES